MSLQSFDPDEYDRSRQFLLDRRCERNHPKRHATKARTKRISAAKRAKAKRKADYALIMARRYRAAARAYWAGLTDGHP